MARNSSSETKSQILLLKRLGYSDRAIAKILGNVHFSTVNRIAHSYANGRSTADKTPRPGRPRILTPKDVRFAALALARSKPATAAAIKKHYFPNASAPTLRRYLRELGLRSFRRRKVPLLKWKQRFARLGWCRHRLTWTQAQWDEIMFSDEVRIELFGPDGTNMCWRYPNQSPYDPRYTKKMVSHGGGGVFLWGCVMREGVGRLYRIHSTLNAVRYTEILRSAMFGTLADYRLSPFDVTFQHDRDPKHTARLTQQWLLRHHVNVLPWPSRSPDLNIIEHVWAHLKLRVRTHSPAPQNQEQLWSVIKQEWHEIRPEFIASLYDSMPRRVQAVYAAKGGNTKY